MWRVAYWLRDQSLDWWKEVVGLIMMIDFFDDSATAQAHPRFRDSYNQDVQIKNELLLLWLMLLLHSYERSALCNVIIIMIWYLGAVCFWQPISSGLNLVVAVLCDSLSIVSLLPCVADCCMSYTVCKVERFVLTKSERRYCYYYMLRYNARSKAEKSQLSLTHVTTIKKLNAKAKEQNE